MAIKITEKTVKNLEAPSGVNRNQVYFDTENGNFAVRVTSKGTKSFILNYRLDGREHRYTIGRHPAWSVSAAREKANELLRKVDAGENIMEQRDKRRQAPTVGDLCERYLSDHARPKKRPGSVREDETMINNYVIPQLGKRKVSDVSFTDIDKFHRGIAQDAPYRANRLLSLLSKMFKLAIHWQYREGNPCQGVDKAQEERRERYLDQDELARLIDALRDFPYRKGARGKNGTWQEVRLDHPDRQRMQSANAIRLLMLTGARKGEVLSAKWEHFDLDAGVWNKPSAHTKQKKAHRVPLSAPARELLVEMKQRAGESSFVFPGPTPDTYQKNLHKAWTTICRDAEIEGLRIHDLRHSYASQLASSGLSLPVIGALLGHTQAQTTQRYAHLLDDPLREATERVGAAYRHAETGKTGEVVDINRKGRGNDG